MQNSFSPHLFTTFIGLLPILTEHGPDAEEIIPMATTLAFGVLFSTYVTLLLVPICYVILDDINQWKWREDLEQLVKKLSI